MNLFDLLDDAANVATAAAAPTTVPEIAASITPPVPRLFAPGVRVRHADGREGRVFLSVPATDRICVRFNQFERPLFVQRLELTEIGPACACLVWENTETIWPDESHVRLTKTCRDCGEVRGRT